MEFSTPKKDINIKHFWTNIDPQVIIKNYGKNLIEKNFHILNMLIWPVASWLPEAWNVFWRKRVNRYFERLFENSHF